MSPYEAPDAAPQMYPFSLSFNIPVFWVLPAGVGPLRAAGPSPFAAAKLRKAVGKRQ